MINESTGNNFHSRDIRSLENLVAIVILFFFIAASIWIVFFRSYYICDVNVSLAYLRKPLKEIIGNDLIEQTFISHVPNLGKFDILPGTFHRRNNSSLHIEISDDVTKKVIRELIIMNSDLQDTQFYSVDFTPIKESNNRSYRISIKSPDGRAGNAVTLWYSPENIYDEGSLRTSFKVVEGDLFFRTGYRVDFDEWFGTLINKTAQGRHSSILGNPMFYIILFFIFVLLMLILSIMLAKFCLRF
ncbi:MAG: hypothetical protein A2161_04810 [Candidatus Schekmanbacteria bacterium RBG_13_48_7]|uniref:Uncharacterized protein n=1 Tax=Candidatus Schekmanbacteria bacterium RBG_13_48_7 TaxID=1817878 RepID=A0A1F7RMM7_9BACT|nr:MAG: hypothetical protein A2161_04810 [Candidatus Schekmanbacteria bacterium RBG_13_48_7]